MAEAEPGPHLNAIEPVRFLLNIAAKKLAHEVEPATTYDLLPHAFEPDSEAETE